MDKKIEIIGGMGPLATCDLFQKIIENTDARTDQEHVHVCIDSNTQIPDRTESILYGGPSPVPEILKSARFLESSHPDVLIMPCNTAHYYYDQIIPHLHTPLLHMPRETAVWLKTHRYKKIGFLATEGTIKAGIYWEPLRQAGITPLIPDTREQTFVTELIYEGIKASNDGLDLSGIHRVIKRLFSDGAETLLLACTELPVSFQQHPIHKNYVDPLRILARAAICFVGAPLTEESPDSCQRTIL